MTKTIQESTNMVFNYSRFHYFDKNGHELILSHHPDVKINILNETHPEFPAEYALVKSTPDNGNLGGNSSLLPINVGMRFGLNDGSTSLNVSTYVNDTSNNVVYEDDAHILNGTGKDGLRISIISDGLNDGIFTSLVSETHSRMEKLESISGATSSGTNNNSFVSMTENLGYPNVIFVSLGTNDSLSNVSIGNFDFETDNLNLNLFAPSYINGIKNIKKKYKDATIICVSFSMKDDYADAIRIVAEYTGCEYVDMRGATSIYTIISKFPDLFSTQYRKYNIHEYQSSFGTQNYPELLYNELPDDGRNVFLNPSNLNLSDKVNFFPTYSFKSRIEFEKVSTELVETQVIYVLVENEFVTDNSRRIMYTPVSTYIDLANQFRNEISEKNSRISYLNGRIAELEEQIREYEEHGIETCDIEYMRMEINACKGEIYDLGSELYDLEEKLSKCNQVSEYAKRFKLMFFIDGREQQDFRMFSTKYDEMTWSDRYFLDLSKRYNPETSDNGYSANIGFSGKYDGVYQQPMYVCLIDTYNKNGNDIGEAYPIGEIMLNAEAEGEDERYRTFFSNFGIPDPKEYNDIFEGTDINDDLPDYISINRNSKKMMLAYSDIFPYIGSYKALINAVKYLGYDDIFFKEWYKEIGNSAMDDSGYTTYEIDFGNTSDKNTIENLDVSERIHLRKMNWISMIYRINEELDVAEDKFGFPTAITIVKNYNTDKLAKLISLKNWIDKYATGVNCKVIDVSGEGLVFERYNLQKFGSYQRVLDYTNENAISPVPVNDAYTLMDGSANIDINIYTNDHIFTIEDLYGKTFVDFCDGYFDENKKFNDVYDGLTDDSRYRYFGKTFELNDSVNSFQIRAKGEHETYRLGKGFVHTNSSMSLIINDDDIIFDCTESHLKYKNTIFEKLPIIQIEKGAIKRYVQNDEPNGVYKYYMWIETVEGGDTYNININKFDDSGVQTYTTKSTPTFIPPVLSGTGDTRTMKSISKILGIGDGYEMTGNVETTYEDGNISTHNGSFGLRYTIDNVNSIPCFKMIGYEEENLLINDGIHAPELSNGNGIEYFVEILNGRMIFNDDENDIVLSVNFSYDENEGKQRIYVNTFSKSDQSTMYEYKISGNKTTKRFNVGTEYGYFVNGYDTNPDDYIYYNNKKSIKVNHTGTYQIDAIMYDKNNNVFAKKSERTVNVLPSYTDIMLYIKEQKSGETHGRTSGNQSSTNSILTSSPNCIMGYSPKFRITTIILDNILNFAGKDEFGLYDSYKRDTGCILNINKKDFDFANISSMSDRIDLSGKDDTNKVLTFVKKSTHMSHLTPEDGNNNYIYSSGYVYNSLKLIGISSSLNNIVEDLNHCRDWCLSNNPDGSNIIKGSMFDSILYVYDDVSEKVVREYNCVMIQNKAYNMNGSTPTSKYDEYKLMFIEQSDFDEFNTQYSSNPKYLYYFIPKWAIAASNVTINKTLNTANLNTNIYDGYIGRGIGYKSSLFVYYKNPNIENYFGYGLYTNVDSDPRNAIVTPFDCDREYNNSVENLSGLNVWFGPSNIKSDEYSCSIEKEESNTHEMFVKLSDNSVFRKAVKNVDYQYSVSLRNFNPNVANANWNYQSINVNNKYEYNIPVITKNGEIYTAPIVTTKFETVENIKNGNVTVVWKVYKRIGLNERKMIMESYNKALALSLAEHGMYDISVDVFDEYGNKYSKDMGGAITYTS